MHNADCQQILAACRLPRRATATTPAPRLGVAVSGGADSVALVLALIEVVACPREQLVVLHVDHGLRVESAADAEWVRGLAESLQLPMAMVRLGDPSSAARVGGREAWARQQRLAAFATWTREHDLAMVAVGHTADDQAETLLLRLLRGTSPVGARCMAGRKRLMTERGPVVLWRPLLACRRDQLRRFLRERGQGWREDASNSDPGYLRNAIRGDVLPMLEKMRGGAAARLARFAADQRQVLAQRRREARRWARRLIVGADLLLQPAPPGHLWSDLLHAWWWRLPASPGRQPDRGVIARLRDLIERGAAGRRLRVAGMTLVRTADRLMVEPVVDLVPDCALSWDEPVEVAGRWFVLRRGMPRGAIDYVVFMTDNVLQFPLRIRGRRPGDRFHPPGAASARRLARWCIDRKIPRHVRDGLPLLADQAQILWVPGWGRSALASADDAEIPADAVVVARYAARPG